MSKFIKIIVEAKPGSGKTNMAEYLYKFLSDNGFDVSIDDIDLNSENINLMGTKEKMQYIKDDVSILIETRQILRSNNLG